MQIGFYFDQTRCIGCFACVAACRSWKEFPQEYPDLIKVTTDEKGTFPNVSLSHNFLTCFHCAKPACIPACPDRLLEKRKEDGVVVMTNQELCTNCGLCVEACPYNALKLYTSAEKNVLLKCDMCPDRRAEGRQPSCVYTCPTEALEIGPINELYAKHGKLKTIENFPDYNETHPSVIFREVPVKAQAK